MASFQRIDSFQRLASPSEFPVTEKLDFVELAPFLNV
jgi:hypothetical protein